MTKWTIENSNNENVETLVPEIGQAWKYKNEPNGKIYIRVKDYIGEQCFVAFSPLSEICSMDENGNVFATLNSCPLFEIVDMKFFKHSNPSNPDAKFVPFPSMPTFNPSTNINQMVGKTLLEKWNALRWEAYHAKVYQINNHKQSGYIDALSQKAYLKEFGTLNINFGRQTGKTYFFKEFLNRYYGCSLGLVTHHKHITDLAMDVGRLSLKTIEYFFTSDTTSGICYKMLIVNDSECLRPEQLDSIYDSAAARKVEMVILC